MLATYLACDDPLLFQSRGRSKGSMGRRRKCLVKKKNEPNPRAEMEKSSSASADNDAAANSSKLSRLTRKGKKGLTFTQLQQSETGFKRPVGRARRTSKGGGKNNCCVVFKAHNPLDFAKDKVQSN